MRYFYDCEFIEDGKTIELISIGIVAEDGREFYAVAEDVGLDPLHGRILKHEWLMKNVVPHLPLKGRAGEKAWAYAPPGSTGTSFFRLDPDTNVVMPRRMIRNAVREFLLGGGGGSETELWAYYGAYDHIVLCQLFGRMIALPPGVPMFTHDIMQLAAGRKPPEQPDGVHNALADARHVKTMFDSLTPLAATDAAPA